MLAMYNEIHIKKHISNINENSGRKNISKQLYTSSHQEQVLDIHRKHLEADFVHNLPPYVIG